MIFRDLFFSIFLPTFFLLLELALSNLFNLDSGVKLVGIAVLCIRTHRIKKSLKYEHIYFMMQWHMVIYCFSVLANNFVCSRVNVVDCAFSFCSTVLSVEGTT